MTARFVCPRCGASSAHPKDLENGYCGRCHDWTGTPAEEFPQVEIQLGNWGPKRLHCPTCLQVVTSIEGLTVLEPAEWEPPWSTSFARSTGPGIMRPCGHPCAGITVQEHL